jgi:hypothetical protein
MAKPLPSIAAAFDNLPTEKPRETTSLRGRKGRASNPENLVLVGANLPTSYARNLALLHAETGKTKKELLQEALDLLFIAKGGAALKL